ncbi:MAG: Type II secretion system protein E (GspE) [Parcubacteria group bacterium GW2011_GWB1_35_5]|uniref:Bacterial type II secretion system protein E domain-containing protein n=1 Tax=Candidatus Zambryskibacteria bacterium RIFCSPLOWO2_01_FULL_35_19 TaxID=1802757 RepID=A0A1G2TVL9_9BACT
MSILDVLVKQGLIKTKDISSIKERVGTVDKNIEDELLALGVSEEDILRAKSEYYSVPVKKVDISVITSKVLDYIPEEAAVYYQFVPIGVSDGVLEVGVIDPDNIVARDALNFISSKISLPFKTFVVSQSDFDEVIKLYKGLSGEVTKALSELETEFITESNKKDDDSEEGAKQKKIETEVDNISDLNTSEGENKGTKVIENAPVTKIVATILRFAIDGRASDIHIEPIAANVKVRFRVDGVMNTSIVLPSRIHSAIVARIKIMSNMRLDEKRKPQDGRFSAKLDKRKVDFRVSTFPTYFGEKVVIRILDQEKGIKKLSELGLSKRNLEQIMEAIKLPYGLILISGPTGSGKSTTLYSMMNEVDKEHKNVLSLEDPVEYNMEGMSQSQVMPEIGYTFASGLRTTLRQDPDIIMVGEIRDKETAQLAIQAALTGHLVFSTIHTNTAIGVIPRLIDMGVDPYLIAPTLALTIAQRLARSFCEGAGRPVKVDASIQMMITKQLEDLPAEFRKEIPIGKEVFEISPAPNCPSGVKGRVAVMEVLKIDKEMEQIILKNPTEQEIWKYARSKGMFTMKDDALIKVFNKVIPFEEYNSL